MNTSWYLSPSNFFFRDASPFVGEGNGAVDAAAEADVIQGVDQLGEQEHVEVAVLRYRPAPDCSEQHSWIWDFCEAQARVRQG